MGCEARLKRIQQRETEILKCETKRDIIRSTHGNVTTELFHTRAFRDANFHFLTLGMQIRTAFSIAIICELAELVLQWPG